MTNDAELVIVARAWLNVRDRRETHFPSELFDEYAFEALLVLFIGSVEGTSVTETHLIERLGRDRRTIVRWLKHLASIDLVARCDTESDEAMTITEIGMDSMRALLMDAGHYGLGSADIN